jgi:hypothetical protein
MSWQVLLFESVLIKMYGIVKTIRLMTGPEIRVQKFTWRGDTIKIEYPVADDESYPH